MKITETKGKIHGNSTIHKAYHMNPDTMTYWDAVTDAKCPVAKCRGVVRWSEAGNVPGYRICDSIHHHRFLADGNISDPVLIRDHCCESKILRKKK